MPARFYEQGVRAKLTDKRRLSAFLDAQVQKHLKKVNKISLTYVFCDDTYLLEINRKFLNHDTFTDIVTFDLSEGDAQLAGEIYISVERVMENAGRYGTDYQTELHRVIFHGMLHLCGFKDKRSAAKAEMTKQEDKCLQVYFKK